MFRTSLRIPALLSSAFVAAVSFLGLPEPVSAQIEPSAGMMRYADVSKEHIVFVYADDLWVVDRTGGMARPLASPEGEENRPRFSPDGKTIAFNGNYDGGRDIYTISVDGGAAERLTYHYAGEVLDDWMPDGESVLYSSGGFSGRGMQQLFTISRDAPVPEQLPVPEGTLGAVSEDGKWLAYIPMNARDSRTWKRYRGGMASDIWLFNLEDNTSKQITDFEGTDSQPMWHGETVYYVCDAGPAHRINIWAYNTETEERRQVTNFTDFDCKWPSIGPGPEGEGEIVVQNGPQLYLVNLENDEANPVSITVPGDRPNLRRQKIDASEFIESAGISSTGKRIVTTARGDVWTLPVENGSPRNLTKTSGANERYPAWSPDGQWVAYFSDESGEYELYTTQSDGRGETKKLTTGGERFRFTPVWSPDSKKIAFTDNSGAIYSYSIESGSTKELDRDPSGDGPSVSWSHDSVWLTYAKSPDPDPATGMAANSSIWVCNTDDGTRHQLTSDVFQDHEPVFDREGDFIYFYSNRGWDSPKYEDLGSTFIYSGTEVLLAMPLRDDVEDPLAAKVDEEEWESEDDESEEDADDDEDGEDEDSTDEDSGDEDGEGSNDADDEGESEDGDKDDGDKDDGDKDDEDKDDEDKEDEEEEDEEEDDDDKEDEEEEEIEPLKIDFEGSERRVFALPVDGGYFGTLAVNAEGHLIYSRVQTQGGDEDEGLMILDLSADEPEEEVVVADITQFDISPDGKKLMLVKMAGGPAAFVVDAAADQSPESPVSTDGMTVLVDPREEWTQMLVEAWRIEREFFYDPTMHGVNWKDVLKQYRPMLDDCVTRRDLGFIIREMISELNVGHAYYRGPDLEDGPDNDMGELGLRFAIDGDRFKVVEMFQGAEWDTDARNPFQRAGGKEGQYLLEVDGIDLTTDRNPYSVFEGKAGKTITLTVSDDKTVDDDDKRLVVRPRRDSGNLRFRGWIEHNRKYVEEKTDGRVGYIYVRDTGIGGQSDLVRQFYSQRHKHALIIDERWNGGGQLPNRFIELLNRPVSNYFALRHATDFVVPNDAHHGPKCMLINGMAGSGGDMFPYLFRQAGLGKLIGTRTWGGLVGISGLPGMIDGSGVTAPGFAFYEKDGTWGVEGHGVDPDIEVVADPALMVDGADPQLDRGIEQMLEELESGAFVKPERPDYPDRTGMGIDPKDK